jgi:toluene monooxygenase system protein E
VPTEYEIATTALLHYVPRGGFEVRASMDDWYAHYQRGSKLAAAPWERFSDPRGTTYTSYVGMRRSEEAFADGLSRNIEETGYDFTLDPAWLDVLERVLPTTRFPMHGFQMLAAYIGQMAPASRLVVAAAFQSADEVRHIQRVALRTAQLRQVKPTFGDASRDAWQHEAIWQPMREAVERALVAFDWGEALVALNVCLKPAFDALFLVEIAESARSRGDMLHGLLTSSLLDDSRWHREWTRAAIATALDVCRDAVTEFVSTWLPRARAAIAPFAGLFGDGAIARADEHLLEDVKAFGLGGIARMPEGIGHQER